MKSIFKMTNRTIAPIQIVLVLIVLVLRIADRAVDYVDLSSKAGFRFSFLIIAIAISVIGVAQIVSGILASGRKIKKGLPSIIAGTLSLLIWLQIGGFYWNITAQIVTLLSWTYFSFELIIIFLEFIIILRGR